MIVISPTLSRMFFDRVTVGFPLASLMISMSSHDIPLRNPVPSALTTASLAAKRAAKCWALFFLLRRQYSCSLAVKIREINRSLKRSMLCSIRAISVMSLPMPYNSVIPFQHILVVLWYCRKSSFLMRCVLRITPAP